MHIKLWRMPVISCNDICRRTVSFKLYRLHGVPLALPSYKMGPLTEYTSLFYYILCFFARRKWAVRPGAAHCRKSNSSPSLALQRPPAPSPPAESFVCQRFCPRCTFTFLMLCAAYLPQKKMHCPKRAPPSGRSLYFLPVSQGALQPPLYRHKIRYTAGPIR